MATKHQHRDLAGETLVEAARDALIEAGEQWTDMRADVFDALGQAGGGQLGLSNP
jgi:Fur family transcriptional regulator, zinc uptake regulator